MKTRYLLLIPLLAGCSWLAGPGAPIVASAVDVIATKLLEQSGKKLDDVPHHCEVENQPSDGKMLMLCTFCYQLKAGETCQ